MRLERRKKAKRGFLNEDNEDAGPPEVSAEELAYLDKQAMYVELERLHELDVICDVQDGVDISQALQLDTKLGRDWGDVREWWPENFEGKVHRQMKHSALLHH